MNETQHYEPAVSFSYMTLRAVPNQLHQKINSTANFMDHPKVNNITQKFLVDYLLKQM
jgi:hypothetical protein